MLIYYKIGNEEYNFEYRLVQGDTLLSIHTLALEDYRKYSKIKVKMPYYDFDNDVYFSSNIELYVLNRSEIKNGLDTLTKALTKKWNEELKRRKDMKRSFKAWDTALKS